MTLNELFNRKAKNRIDVINSISANLAEEEKTAIVKNRSLYRHFIARNLALLCFKFKINTMDLEFYANPDASTKFILCRLLDSYYFINMNSLTIASSSYTLATPFLKGAAKARKGGKMFFIDANFKRIGECCDDL